MVDVCHIAYRLILAAVLSGIIGFEREIHGRAAGLRTTILVGVGSCLIMITSMHLHAIYANGGNVDPSRIAAQVVSGIGFLGAGTIIRFRASIRGLTTAAGLWAVAGIGLAVGSGFYSAALMTTTIIFLVLVALSDFERKIKKEFDKTLKIEANGNIEQLCQITKVVSSFHAEIKDIEIKPSLDETSFKIDFNLKLYTLKLTNQITEALLKVKGVSTVKWV